MFSPHTLPLSRTHLPRKHTHTPRTHISMCIRVCGVLCDVCVCVRARVWVQERSERSVGYSSRAWPLQRLRTNKRAETLKKRVAEPLACLHCVSLGPSMSLSVSPPSPPAPSNQQASSLPLFLLLLLLLLRSRSVALSFSEFSRTISRRIAWCTWSRQWCVRERGNQQQHLKNLCRRRVGMCPQSRSQPAGHVCKAAHYALS